MSAHSHHHAAMAPAEGLDPVCGMTISPDDAVGHVDHEGHPYYFCSQSCLEQFKADPERFLTPSRPDAAATPADKEREYTCPMDPDVRQKGPGACPKCGMALEPVDVAPVTKTEWTCPMHPEIVRDAPVRVVPDLRYGARTTRRHVGRAQPRTGRHDPPVPLVARRYRADSRLHDLRVPAWSATAARCPARSDEAEPAQPVPPYEFGSGIVPVVSPDIPNMPWRLENGVKVFDIGVEHVRTELIPGRVMDGWGFNGSIPGPTIQVTEGEHEDRRLPDLRPT